MRGDERVCVVPFDARLCLPAGDHSADLRDKPCHAEAQRCKRLAVRDVRHSDFGSLRRQQ